MNAVMSMDCSRRPRTLHGFVHTDGQHTAPINDQSRQRHANRLSGTCTHLIDQFVHDRRQGSLCDLHTDPATAASGRKSPSRRASPVVVRRGSVHRLTTTVARPRIKSAAAGRLRHNRCWAT